MCDNVTASTRNAKITELLSTCGDHQLKLGDFETLPLSSFSHVNHDFYHERGWTIAWFLKSKF